MENRFEKNIGYERAIVFGSTSSFAPFCGEQSVFTLKIANRFLAEHIAESLVCFQENIFRSIVIGDEWLAGCEPLKDVLRRYLPVECVSTVDLKGPGLRYYTAPQQSFPICGILDVLKMKDDVLKKVSPVVSKSAVIEKGVEIEGRVYIGENVKILSGTRLKGNVYIGDNTFIANNCLIRGHTSLGENSRLGYACEIKNSLIGDDVGVGPLSAVLDSVIGQGTFLGAMVRLSNFRLDRKTVHIFHDGQLVDSGLSTLGAVIGCKTNLGISTLIYPGRIVGNNVLVEPHIVIKKNVSDNVHLQLRQEIISQIKK